MTAPISLSAPDGTVYAWACSTCRRAYGERYGCEPAGIGYGMPHLSAERCCMKCPCGNGMYDEGPLCFGCRAGARHAFNVLACIGMAVAVREYGDVCVRVATLGGGRTGARGERQTGIVATLCGVTPETVRGWR